MTLQTKCAINFSTEFGTLPSKRRFRTVEEKRRIVEEALQPGASVARVARARGVNANQLFGWRRLYQQVRLGDRAFKIEMWPEACGSPVKFPTLSANQSFAFYSPE